VKTLLKIRSSIYGPDGQSSKLADKFARAWLGNHPGGRVVTRDLTPESMPHLTAARFRAFAVPAAERTAEQRAAVEFSDALIDELKAADEIVIAVPMYNFSVPSTLRAWFDHIARAGVTFRFTEDGPVGLIDDRRTFVIITRGGSYEGRADTQAPYLKQFLSFIGLTDIEWILAEGLAVDETKRIGAVEAANETIARLQSAGPAAAA
jgi:FMN-dependent NADH-azoreductase